MKRFCYLAVMLLLTSIVLLFYIKKPDGQPYLSLSMLQRYSQQVSHDVTQSASQNVESWGVKAEQLLKQFSEPDNGHAAVVVYKWQDEQGQWHFADTPHPQYASTLVTLDSREITVLPAESFQADPESKLTETQVKSAADSNLYDPKKIQQLIQDAEQIKLQIEQRNKQLEH
ncbi:hypothetical protein AT00_20865 [Pseudoalteromonas lipolytica SCSIO 04301]|jgi:hypothetical protein|uniref:DUF4124 domain-containing protein n=1 Tax=Pseudoalteromonas TaxID=53246 RepID=UPI00044E5FA1|nr:MULTISPECIES: DUF4124 domain-containing protein [Pseudoalteromonas]EWH04285.1 hypothetical protein AT00_20865 [Pseudoalteromonas lipolytica SCSIO 04301]MCC9660661.1 DUF4124 domain-containing protein [Pseudoalteromonas sp. MB41]